MIPLADILALGSGTLIGLTLGLIGGGGSILAVPLLVYVVGVASPHVAIGTSAIAVRRQCPCRRGAYMRWARSVKWPCALVFAGSGIIGAFLGARAGKAVGGEFLLFLFGLVMIAVGIMMLRRKGEGGNPDVHLDQASAPALLPSLTGYGLGVGLLSGFFGIGGGFLIVPGLINATNMPDHLRGRIVARFRCGLRPCHGVELRAGGPCRLACGGAAAGRWRRRRAPRHDAGARRLAAEKALLARLFAVIVMLVGLYVSGRGAHRAALAVACLDRVYHRCEGRGAWPKRARPCCRADARSSTSSYGAFGMSSHEKTSDRPGSIRRSMTSWFAAEACFRCAKCEP